MYFNFFNPLKTVSLILFVGLLLSIEALAQNQKKIDSLNLILPKSSMTIRAEILMDLGIEYFQSNSSTALQYIDEAHSISLQLGDSAGIVSSGWLQGEILRRIGKISESIKILKSVLPISDRNNYSKDYKRILNTLAIDHTFLADYDKALEYHFKSLIARESEGDKEGISISLNNIGLVYFKLRNHEKALEYYYRALEIKEEIHDIYDLDILLVNMGLCYNQLFKYDEAQKFINRGLSICKGQCSELIRITAEFGLGNSFFGLGNLNEAERHFLTSLKSANSSNDKRHQAENLIFLARISIQNKNTEQAIRFLNDAELIADGTGLDELLIDIYRHHSAILNTMQDYKSASFYQNKYIQLKDSTYSDQLIKNLAKVQTNYEERENIKTIAEKNAVLALKEETLKRQRTETQYAIVVSVLVFVLAILMLQLFRITRRANAKLEMRVEQRTKELNDTVDDLAKVNSELDNFIYKTSHDIRGPLASLKGICNVAIMDVRDEGALNYLQKLDVTAERLNTILTRLLIINQINHAVLAANVINFEELIEEILMLERKKGVPKRLSISYEVDHGFTVRSDRDMMRIVLENLIDNAIKFYNESERVEPFVKIQITKQADHVIIKVTDNGVGINDETKEKIFQMFVRASERSETGGIGLYLSKLATGRLGGTIEFSSTPKKHTEFTVVFPLDLGPVLDKRKEQERIRDFEKVQQREKQKVFTAS